MTKDEAQRRRWTFYEAVIFPLLWMPTSRILRAKSCIIGSYSKSVPHTQFLSQRFEGDLNSAILGFGIARYRIENTTIPLS